MGDPEQKVLANPLHMGVQFDTQNNRSVFGLFPFFQEVGTGILTSIGMVEQIPARSIRLRTKPMQ